MSEFKKVNPDIALSKASDVIRQYFIDQNMTIPKRMTFFPCRSMTISRSARVRKNDGKSVNKVQDLDIVMISGLLEDEDGFSNVLPDIGIDLSFVDPEEVRLIKKNGEIVSAFSRELGNLTPITINLINEE